MDSNKIRYYADNIGKIIEGLNSVVENLPEDVAEKLENPESVDEMYNMISNASPDFFQENKIDLSSFKLILFLSDPDQGDALYSDSEYKDVLKGLIDIYGDNSLEKINYYSSDISFLKPLLSLDDPKYSDIYKEILKKKISSAETSYDMQKIISSADPRFIDKEMATVFLEKSNYESDKVRYLLQTLPETVTQDSSFIETIIEKSDDIKGIIDSIPTATYDSKIVNELIEKSDIKQVFNYIPSQFRTRNLWEKYVDSFGTYNKQEYSFDKVLRHIPTQNIDPSISDEEYISWLNNLIIRKMTENSHDAMEIFSHLDPQQITSELCQKAVDVIPFRYSDGTINKYNIKEFLEHIPNTVKTQQFYETIVPKIPYALSMVPSETFVSGISQEQYDKWFEDLIVLSISKNDDLRVFDNSIPIKRFNQNVWNKWLDKCIESKDASQIISISEVPIENLTTQMIERAVRDIGSQEAYYIPCVDKNLDTIMSNTGRMLYEQWLSSMTEEQKQRYREWYENFWINFVKTDVNHHILYATVPKEGMTLSICTACANLSSKDAHEIIDKIPLPKNEEELQEYQSLLINILKKYGKSSSDFLEPIPKEYINEAILKVAAQCDQQYLKYADPTAENYNELLNIGFKNALGYLGRTELTDREIELMRKFVKNNEDVFSSLLLPILDPKIVSILGESTIEKISRYGSVQSDIISISKNINRLKTFSIAFENLKGENPFVGPLVEKLSKIPLDFSNIVVQRLEEGNTPLTDYEKAMISYFAINPEKCHKIKSYNDILTFVEQRDNELMNIINNPNSTLLEIKSAYLEKMTGLDYNSVLNLVTLYGNDPEQLLQSYKDMSGKTDKERSEKEALEIIVKLRSLIDCQDANAIRNEFQKKLLSFSGEPSYIRYQKSSVLEDSLRRAYGREVVSSLTKDTGLFPTEEATFEGEKYLVRKLDGDFNRMISVLGAYRESDAIEGDMYDRWNTSKMANNHALCYSLINQSNPGTALTIGKTGIIISVNGFVPEALLAAAPYDLWSDNRHNSIQTRRQQRFFTTENMSNQSRELYSEYDIEIEDVFAEGNEYKKIQPASIICFEEADEESIKAAIELSKKLGYPVPIEIIDRKKLAEREMENIQKSFNDFKNSEKIDANLIKDFVTRFENVRSAHVDSANQELTFELLGDRRHCPEDQENKSAPFHISRLNEMLAECLDNIEERMKTGEVQEGLDALKSVKEILFEERQKFYLLKTMYEKALCLGIDTSIDYTIDELQRIYGKINVGAYQGSKSLKMIEQMQINGTSSISFDAIYDNGASLPDQLTANQVAELVDIDRLQEDMAEIHAQGYYQGNKAYDEENVARVTLYSQAIAKMEGLDDRTTKLLTAASEYYSCGRQLDVENIRYGGGGYRERIFKENHGEYSAKLAGKALSGKYSEDEVTIVQSVIEMVSAYPIGTKKFNELKENLSSKYELTEDSMLLADQICSILTDSMTLDYTRFSESKDNDSHGMCFYKHGLSTESAKKMVEFSYSMQENLAQAEIDELSKIVSMDYDAEEENIKQTVYAAEEKIASSPRVRRDYLKSVHKELLDVEPSIDVVQKEQNKDKEKSNDSQEILELKEQRRDLRRQQFDDRVAQLGLQEEVATNLEQLFEQQQELMKQASVSKAQPSLEQGKVAIKK